MEANVFRVRYPDLVLGAGCLAILVSACGGTTASPVAPTAPTPTAAPSFPVVRLTGHVSDTLGRPLVANVAVFPLRLSPPWYGPWGRASQSDASGRYQIADAPEDPDTAYVHASKDGYVQPCASAITLATDMSVDLTLTPVANVAVMALPSLPNARQIGGTVYTSKDGERQPVAGASVGWEMAMDTVVAETVTDAQGRYRICGLPRDRLSGVYAQKGNGMPKYIDVAAGGDALVDFDLP
jgi:hypothetical protein